MVVLANPANIWKRMLIEMDRLAGWARRSGTEEQKLLVREELTRLNAFAASLELTLMPTHAIDKMDNTATPTEDEGDQSIAIGYSAYMRGENYNSCPILPTEDIPSPDQWRKGYLMAQSKHNPKE